MAAKDEQDQLTEADRAFARSMRAARHAAGLSQGDLARMLSDMGAEITQATVSRIEGSRRAARLGEARSIALVLGEELDAMSLPDSRTVWLSDMRDDLRTAARTELELRELAATAAKAWNELEISTGLAEGGPMLESDSDSAEFRDLLRKRVDEARRLLARDPMQSAQSAFEQAKMSFERAKMRRQSDGEAADSDQ